MTHSDDLEKTIVYRRSDKPMTSADSDTITADKTTLAPKKKATIAEDKTQFIPRKIPAGTPEPSAANTSSKKSAPPVKGAISSNMVLKNRFVLEQLLGAGGMGVVYKAKDLLKIEAQDKDPYVAIKVLTDEFKTHPEAFIALQRESRKTQRIAHPNIVTVFDFDRDGDTVFMTMEYLDGSPLDKIIAQYRSIGLPHDEVYKIIEGLCAALTYAHAQHIIHSDFKPGNIFVNTKGVAKVIDFGIARAVAKVENRAESTDDKTLFDAGNLGALTPAYASLEMLEGKVPDIRDDIYALGCIIYELYTGIHPFNRIHADEAKKKNIKPKRIQGIKKYQWKAIEQMLAFDRNNRTESVSAFWKKFSTKPKKSYGILFTTCVAIGALGFTYYKINETPLNLFSEDQVRNEIEIKLRIEMMQNTLLDLIKSSEFDVSWENNLWLTVKELRQLPQEYQEWTKEKEIVIYELYKNHIRINLDKNELNSIDTWLTNAERYNNDESLTQLREEFNHLLSLITESNSAAVRAQTSPPPTQTSPPVVQPTPVNTPDLSKKEFAVALENVNRQLNCGAGIDMKDFEIAIDKLKSLNKSLYTKEEPKIINSLVKCIQLIGSSVPERGEMLKRMGLRIFVNNPAISNLSFVSKDPCSLSLAGQGARGIGSSCRDSAPNNIKGPYLVVVPARGNMPAFAISKYEITNEEFNSFCKELKSCNLSDLDPSLPVVNLSLNTLRSYLRWLSQKTSYTYRLPSFVEWQYAAKASNSYEDPNRNCKLNSRGITKGGNLIKASVGQQNSWGLVNTLGNAREIVVGRGGEYYAMGGSYETEMGNCNFNLQQSLTESGDTETGFRVIRELKI